MHLAQQAYSAPTQARTRPPRATEYAAFARVTARIKAADTGSARDFPALVAALDENRKLWRLLAIDVADRDNSLPRDLRARIFYLYEFTDHHTSRVLACHADTGPLVEINTAIMRGLAKSEAVA
nr:flagellar biosynthesis regulator FlaF [Rhodovulum strictum]